MRVGGKLPVGMGERLEMAERKNVKIRNLYIDETDERIYNCRINFFRNRF